MNTRLRWITSIYAFILRLYPPAFIQEMGDEMKVVFAQMTAEAKDRGGWSLFSVCLRELRDLPVSLAEAYRSRPQGGIPMKTPDYSRWFGDPALPPDVMEPRPWREVLLGLLFFGLCIVAFTSYNWSQFLPFDKAVDIKIGNVTSAVSFFVFLGMAIWGGIRKFPDWSLPYQGFILALLSLFILLNLTQYGPTLWMAILFFLSPLILVVLSKFIRPLGALWKNLWEDPTRLGWMYIGTICLGLIIILDDQKGEYLYKSLTLLWFFPAVIFYLRSRRLWQRVIIPPVSFLCAWVGAIPMTLGLSQPFAELWENGLAATVRVGLLILSWFLLPGLWILLRRVKWIALVEA